MPMSLRLEPDYGGKCPDFLAPAKYRLSRAKLKGLDTYEESDLSSVTAESLEGKFRTLSRREDIVVPDFELILKEWWMNAISHGSEYRSGILPGKEDKYRVFSAATEGLFYLGVQDPGQGFDLRSVLESGRYVEPALGIRGRGICEISREQLDWIYNINRAHDHTIVGIKKF